jgi:hypothetical protein
MEINLAQLSCERNYQRIKINCMIYIIILVLYWIGTSLTWLLLLLLLLLLIIIIIISIIIII